MARRTVVGSPLPSNVRQAVIHECCLGQTVGADREEASKAVSSVVPISHHSAFRSMTNDSKKGYDQEITSGSYRSGRRNPCNTAYNSHWCRVEQTIESIYLPQFLLFRAMSLFCACYGSIAFQSHRKDVSAC